MVRFHISTHYDLILNVLIGTGITTSLISLIANAGPEDQAIATAGKLAIKLLEPRLTTIRTVSYLFRSLGSVVGLSVGSTLIQITLRTSLRRALSGQDVDEVSHYLTGNPIIIIDIWKPLDHLTSQRIIELHR